MLQIVSFDYVQHIIFKESRAASLAYYFKYRTGSIQTQDGGGRYLVRQHDLIHAGM